MPVNRIPTRTIGNRGEDAAAHLLQKSGLEIIERNFSCKIGEIDIIAADLSQRMIVFAEVKARTSSFFGYPESAVDRRKKTHIIRSAYYYLSKSFPDDADIPWHVDIIALIYKSDRKTIRDFKWFENVTADE